MDSTLRIALAQIDCCVGAIKPNRERMARCIADARDVHHADLVAFPELAISGYPPEDLLLRPSFVAACGQALDALTQASSGIAAVVGHPLPLAGPSPHGVEPVLGNCASMLGEQSVTGQYLKQVLPGYGVFDEKRYFAPGDHAGVFPVRGVPVGLLVCEDVWREAPVAAAVAAGARLLLVVNASPYEMDKHGRRVEALSHQAATHRVGIAYLNLVGGQDDLLFDGASLLIDADGQVAAVGPAFEEALLMADYDADNGRFTPVGDGWTGAGDPLATLWAGLVVGVRDYVHKNGFEDVLLGLSGGIDSALVLALAVDALGAEHVTAVMLPSQYTSELSLAGAQAQAKRLGVDYRTLSIEPAFAALSATLAPEFSGLAADTTEENMQARVRGVLLMALSNKHRKLLLATGNKSELAVGYATLYGDMCGAYAPIKDVYKTMVYRLARWRNARGDGEIIPAAVIERPPSAELRADQTDQDSLPDYAVLDEILRRFLEGEESQAEIIAAGFDADLVHGVVRMVLRNEFKRRQSPPGPRVSVRAFGRERRFPISSGWR